MFLMIRSLIVIGLLTFICPASNASSGEASDSSGLGRGLNYLGNQDFWLGLDPGAFRNADLIAIRSAGFSHVRINIMPFASMAASDDVPPSVFSKIDMVLRRASEQNLKVILDLHEHRFCAKNAFKCSSKTVAFWEQMSQRYQGLPGSVAFEILNEPHGDMNGERWNSLLQQSLDVIRKHNPRRLVVIGPADSNSFKELGTLQLPSADKNLVVTFHYYVPFPFTHQGASWTRATYRASPEWLVSSGMGRLNTDLDEVRRWASANGRPILLGEFGVIKGASASSRASWASAVARAAESRGFAWSYWNFNGGSFGIYDRSRRRWESPMLDALVSP